MPSEVLNDLCSRFIINVAIEPKPSTKLCYQLELAYWFYLDFERTDNPKLPSLKFDEFSFQMLSHVAALKHLAAKVCDLQFILISQYMQTLQF